MKISRTQTRKAEKWRKPYADRGGLRQALNKINGTLDSWDYLPMGEKVGRIKTLHSALSGLSSGAISEFPREFGYRIPTNALDKERWAGIVEHVKKRLDAENENLRDMKNVFSEWGVELGKIKLKVMDKRGKILGNAPLRVEHVSYPYGMNWRMHPEKDDLMTFSSPVLSRWYERRVLNRQLQRRRHPFKSAPSGGVVELINERKAFGIGELNVDPKTNRARIGFVQPLKFFQTRLRDEEKTVIKPPLEHPDILMLYGMLKEAKTHDAREVHFWDIFRPDDERNFKEIYRRILQLAKPTDSPMGFSKTENAYIEMYRRSSDDAKFIKSCVFRRRSA